MNEVVQLGDGKEVNNMLTDYMVLTEEEIKNDCRGIRVDTFSMPKLDGFCETNLPGDPLFRKCEAKKAACILEALDGLSVHAAKGLLEKCLVAYCQCPTKVRR